MALADAAQSTENTIALLLQAADRLRNNGDKEAACCMIDFLFLLFSENADKALGGRNTEISDFGQPDLDRFVRGPLEAV